MVLNLLCKDKVINNNVHIKESIFIPALIFINKKKSTEVYME